MQFVPGGSFPYSEVDPPVRDKVETRDAFRGAGRMVVLRDHLADSVAQPDPAGLPGRGGKEDLGRRAVRVLLEEMVFDSPRVVDADAVGEHDLLERIAEQPVFVPGSPRTRQLKFVEDTKSHVGDLSPG